MGRQPEPERTTGALSNAVVGDVSGTVVQAGTIGSLHLHQPGVLPVTLPYRAGVVPLRARCFQGRATSQLLARVIGDGDIAVLTSDGPAHTSVLSGLGGVGKTQLAVDYVEDAWAEGKIDFLAWVTAESRESVLSSYSRLASDLTGVEDPDPELGAQRLLTWLANTSKRWFIVLDDLQNPADMRALWPPVVPAGHVLLTTRRRDASLHGHRRRLIEIGLFTEAESRAYLAAALTEQSHLLDGADDLARELGHLPLALAQAAAYMLDHCLSCAAYARRFTDRRRSLASLLPDADELPDEHRDTVAATWSLSIERADRLPPEGLAGPLLQLASLLDANGIPVQLFTGSAATAYLASTIGKTVNNEQASDALHCLHRLNLIAFDSQSAPRAVRIHALVQRAIRDSLPDDQRLLAVHAAANALQEVWPDIERDTVLGQVLRTNVDALRAVGDDHLWNGGCHPLLVRAGRSLGEAGLVMAAHAYFQRLLAVALQKLGQNHVDTLTARENIAHWQGESGDPAGAVVGLRRLLIDRSRVLGADHPDVLATRDELALWRGQAGDAAGAVGAYEDLLADRLRLLGSDHADTDNTRGNVAYWRGRAGDAAGAAAVFQELLDDRRRFLGSDHPTVLITRSNLAYWHGHSGHAEKAIVELEELLSDQVRILGPDHVATLNTRNNLACWRGYAGDAVRAANALRDLLADRLRILGADHRLTMVTRHNLYRWRGETGDVFGAHGGFEELLAERTRILGPDHPHTLNARGEIARWRGESGRATDAVVMLEDLLSDRIRILGREDPDTVYTRHNIAYWRGCSGDARSALTDTASALDDLVQILGPDHLDTLKARNSLVRWSGESGDVAGALGSAKALLSDVRRQFAVDHRLTLAVRHNYWRWRGESHDADGAVAGFRELLTDRLRISGPHHPHSLQIRCEIARWLGESGHVEDTVAALDDLLSDCLRVLGADHPRTIATRASLAYWSVR